MVGRLALGVSLWWRNLTSNICYFCIIVEEHSCHWQQGPFWHLYLWYGLEYSIVFSASNKGDWLTPFYNVILDALVSWGFGHQMRISHDSHLSFDKQEILWTSITFFKGQTLIILMLNNFDDNGKIHPPNPSNIIKWKIV